VVGSATVLDEDGHAQRTSRPVSAICRCGRSGNPPWCDATHKALPPGWEPIPLPVVTS
jgi:CDGSH-type Zn-finger protein